MGCQIVGLNYYCAEDDAPATMDAIMLMLLHSLGGAWRTSAESTLKKKFASGILTSDLFKRILTGHQVTECKPKHLASPHSIEERIEQRCMDHEILLRF